MLMSGFIQVGYYYFFSKQVIRSVVYGDLVVRTTTSPSTLLTCYRLILIVLRELIKLRFTGTSVAFCQKKL
ncbi:unnamed protein product [Linum trigynum]|uniref:Uncharacterized protein n=1 Tax=Linum trigynum TaxID=586398 RepID=A0AAV2CND7_9ROSI